MIRKLLGVALVVALLLVAAWFALTPFPLGDASDQAALQHRIGFIVELKGDGKVALIETIDPIPIRFDDLPEYVSRLLILREDHRFLSHPGVDFIGIGRAIVRGFFGRTEGASTLTMQLARLMGLSKSQDALDKLVEMGWALRIDAMLTKERLLEMYWNRVPLGNGAIGIEAASLRLFGKRARDLLPVEAALIVQSLPGPGAFSYSVNPNLALQRASALLSLATEQGIFGKMPDLVVKPGGLEPVQFDRVSLFEAVAREIEAELARLHAKPDRYFVYSTLDPTLQLHVTSAVRAKEDQVARMGADQLGAVMLGRDGRLLAFVGSLDRSHVAYNVSLIEKRPIASCFKPFLYLGAFESGLDPASTVSGARLTGNYQPNNADGKYPKSVELRYALAGSINTAAVRVYEMVGREAVASVLKRVGLVAELREGDPSVALGSVGASLYQLTSAYAVLSNGGRPVKPYTVYLIRDLRGEVLYRSKAHDRLQKTAPIFDRKALASLIDAMTLVVDSGTGQKARIKGHHVAGKTGTNEDARDAWFVGMLPDQLVAGVWMGNMNYEPMSRSAFGGGVPAEVWREIMIHSIESLGLPPDRP